MTSWQGAYLHDIAEELKNIRKILEKHSTTEQSSVVGEWIDHYYPYFEVAGIECSVCGEDVPYWQRHYENPNFCPNCGAKMKG